MKIIDESVLELINGLHDVLIANSDSYIQFAIALAGAFAMLYVGFIGLAMLAGDRRLDVISIMRPFAFGLVIYNWVTIVNGVDNVFMSLENEARESVYSMVDKVDELQRERDEKKVLLAGTQARVFAKFAVDEKGLVATGVEKVTGVDISEFASQAIMWKTMIDVKIKDIINNAIEGVFLGLFSSSAYLLIFLKMMFLYVMAVLGPIAFAFSIIPSFGTAYVSWISRYISVSFYGVIGYTFMFLTLTLISFGLDIQKQALDSAISATEAINVGDLNLENDDILTAVSNTIKIAVTGAMNESVILIVMFILGTIALICVPVVSTWILQTSGAGQALSKATGATATIAKGAVGGI